jgi:hypothetical protein
MRPRRGETLRGRARCILVKLGTRDVIARHPQDADVAVLLIHHFLEERFVSLFGLESIFACSPGFNRSRDSK